MVPIPENLRKLLEDQERMDRLTNPSRELRETLARIQGVSGFTEAAAKLSGLNPESRVHQVQAESIARTAHLAQIYDLHVEPLRRAMEEIQGSPAHQSLMETAARFADFKPNRLYRHLDLDELTKLSANFKTNTLISDQVRELAERTGLFSRMAEMDQPWLSRTEPGRSLAGFAEMQTIGSTLLSRPAYETVASDVVRHALGDWRGVALPTTDRFLDTAFRNEFYVQHGLQTDLTNFSTPAFEEGMGLAGFRPLTDVNLDKPVDEEEIEFERNNKAQGRIQRVEVYMRRFIVDVLTKAHEGKWVKRSVPKLMAERWQEKHDDDVAARRTPRKALIDYSEFSDLWQIMERGDNWPLFAGYFRQKEEAKVSFSRLHILRVQAFHSVMIDNMDAMMLQVEASQVMRAIQPGVMHDWL